MVRLPEDWKKYPIPLGLLAAVLLGVTTYAPKSLDWADARYVLSVGYAADRYFDQRTRLEQEMRSLEREKLKLDVKCDTLHKCNAVDNIVRKTLNEQLQELRQELRELNQRHGKK